MKGRYVSFSHPFSIYVHCRQDLNFVASCVKVPARMGGIWLRGYTVCKANREEGKGEPRI